MRRLLVGIGALLLPLTACGASTEIVIGSKAFTEGVVLGEVLTLAAESTGRRVRHRRELGGTRVLWSALIAGDVDAYVEYTGTLSEEVFGGAVPATREALAEALGDEAVQLGPDLGFSNSYAVGVRRPMAEALGLQSISDLAARPELLPGFSSEFMDREDGWPGLREAYGLPYRGVSGMEHALAYRALASGEIDVTDLYTTDPEIALHDLTVLRDDRFYFPEYRAVLLYRNDLEVRAPEVVDAFQQLRGAIDVTGMIGMNVAAVLERVPESEVAARFVSQELGLSAAGAAEGLLQRQVRHGLEHLLLVAVSLSAAVALAIPLGIAAARRPGLGAIVLGGVGVLQTIPSLALLVFMIPLLGIGAPPAIAALFLYSLLPIVRNTATGLASIPPDLLESADALGLPRGARLRLVELPMASPAILAGIKTAAVINVGTATLGALVGAGGYGQPILTGIRLDDVSLILQGAVPAALVALLAQGFFALLERHVVPRGLRL